MLALEWNARFGGIFQPVCKHKIGVQEQAKTYPRHAKSLFIKCMYEHYTNNVHSPSMVCPEAGLAQQTTVTTR